MTISRTLADEIAAKVTEALTPHVHRIEPCGQLRMRMPTVSSMDFVVAPFDIRSMVERCRKNCRIGQVAPKLLSLDMANGQMINLHLAWWDPGDLVTPGRGNVGVQIILRTGTRSFIRDLLAHVRTGGYQLDPERGLTYGREVVAYEEEEIFLALGIENIPPTERIEFKPTPLFEAVPL